MPPASTTKHRIGVISDSHGLLRSEAVEVLKGTERIIHAGDIGREAVLEALEEIAPVTAVRGNMDGAPWARRLPETDLVQVGGCLLYVLHDVSRLDLDPAAAGFHAVIFGHSHRPHIERRNGVLYLNPGSAGPSRFRLPVTVALLTINGSILDAAIVELEP